MRIYAEDAGELFDDLSLRIRERRSSTRPTVGLALGSGAARGLSHIGVLEVLEDAGIEPDVIAGCSIGAVVGSLYACGISVSEMRRIALKISRLQMIGYSDLTVSKRGLIGGNRIADFLSRFYNDCSTCDTEVPFVAVATDVLTGEEIVFGDDDRILDAVRSSLSIPGIFVPHTYQERHLVDGALVNPVPIDYLNQCGVDLTIAVNVVPRVRRKAVEDPSIFDILINSFEIISGGVAKSRMVEPDVEIHPEVDSVTGLEFWRAEELIDAGRHEAEKAVDTIRKRIEDLRPKGSVE